MAVSGTTRVGTGFIRGAVTGTLADATVAAPAGGTNIVGANTIENRTSASIGAGGLVSGNVALSSAAAGGARLESPSAVVTSLQTTTLQSTGTTPGRTAGANAIPRVVAHSVTGTGSLRTDAMTVGNGVIGTIAVEGQTIFGRPGSGTTDITACNPNDTGTTCPTITKNPGPPDPG
jgi:hypothetical protein